MSRTKSQIGRSNRQRGFAFERLMAKKLNKLLGSNFRRSPMSGGQGIQGDLFEPPDQKTKWSEYVFWCRTTNRADLDSFICNGKGVMSGWFKELKDHHIWLIRTSKNCIFMIGLMDRFSAITDLAIACARVGDVVLFPLVDYGIAYKLNES